uniref:Uncharacterized protein n=1 Tax=Cacopsylla melanoneura TaxID=428564 RepID=A0A8D8U4M0_9HEMI
MISIFLFHVVRPIRTGFLSFDFPILLIKSTSNGYISISILSLISFSTFSSKLLKFSFLSCSIPKITTFLFLFSFSRLLIFSEFASTFCSTSATLLTTDFNFLSMFTFIFSNSFFIISFVSAVDLSYFDSSLVRHSMTFSRVISCVPIITK